MRRHTLGSLMVVGCALSWGAISIIVRELDMPAMVIVFYRVLFSALAVAAAIAISRRLRLLRAGNRAVLALGVLLAFHWVCYFAAIKETSVASAVLITYAGPIFMAMVAPLLIHERVPPVSLAAIAISLAGIAVITFAGGSGDEAVRPLGVALALAAAVSFAFLIVLLKRYAHEVHPLTVVLYTDGAAALLLFPAALVGDYSLGAAELGYLLLLGVVLTGVAGVVYVAALRWVAATTAGILAYIEPVAAALLAAALLGERLTAAVVVGGAAIVAAGVAVVLRAPEAGPTGAEEVPVPVGAQEAQAG